MIEHILILGSIIVAAIALKDARDANIRLEKQENHLLAYDLNFRLQKHDNKYYGDNIRILRDNLINTEIAKNNADLLKQQAELPATIQPKRVKKLTKQRRERGRGKKK